ncbi:hypothetical protein AHAS_Ahas01G0303300 [Arachis hypogaea]
MASLPHVSMRKTSIQHRNLLHESENFSKTGQLNNPMVKDKDGIQLGNQYNDSNWSLSMDEDYIVFCFGEDGSFDVVKEVKSNNYADDEELQEETDKQMHGNRSNDDEQYQNCTEFFKEEEIKEMEREQIREGIDEFGILYSELGDSNRSEGSNGSFAFPVLNWEWMGSPVKMPKSEDICQKKQKIRFIPFQCCRF